MASGAGMAHLSKVRLACGKRGTRCSHLQDEVFHPNQKSPPILGLAGGNHLQKPSTGKNANLLEAQKQTQLKSADKTKIKGDGRNGD